MNNEMDEWLSGFFEMNPDAAEIEEPVKTPVYKNDIFKDILPALDRRDIHYYSKLNDEQKKDISIWILTRWMSSISRDSATQIFTVNEVVNKNSLSLNKHKELQWMLLAICGTGKPERHVWPSAPKGIKKTPIVEELLKFYPLLKDSDIELLLQLNTQADLIQFFKDNGYDDKSIKELCKGDAKGK